VEIEKNEYGDGSAALHGVYEKDEMSEFFDKRQNTSTMRQRSAPTASNKVQPNAAVEQVTLDQSISQLKLQVLECTFGSNSFTDTSIDTKVDASVQDIKNPIDQSMSSSSSGIGGAEKAIDDKRKPRVDSFEPVGAPRATSA
jgi:hypothetical protein